MKYKINIYKNRGNINNLSTPMFHVKHKNKKGMFHVKHSFRSYSLTGSSVGVDSSVGITLFSSTPAFSVNETVATNCSSLR